MTTPPDQSFLQAELDVTSKGPQDVVSQADVNTELLITEAGGQVNDFLAGNALHDGNRIFAGAPAFGASRAGLLRSSR